MGALGLLGTQKAKAQQNLSFYDVQNFNFGFLIGFTANDLHIVKQLDSYSQDSLLGVSSVSNTGIKLGIISNLKVSKNIDLRITLPTLAFTDRTLSYSFADPSLNREIKLESAYVEFPVAFKFKTNRIRNVRVYFITGAKYGYDVLFNRRNDPENPTQSEIPVKLGANNFEFSYGFGVDLYYEYFKFSPEIRISNGMNNLLIPIDPPNEYHNPLKQLLARTVTFTFHFE